MHRVAHFVGALHSPYNVVHVDGVGQWRPVSRPRFGHDLLVAHIIISPLLGDQAVAVSRLADLPLVKNRFHVVLAGLAIT